MMVYLLKSIACLLVLLLVHRLLLQREAMHRFNRFFLLFSVVASFFIPFYTIEVHEEIVAAPVEVLSQSTYFEATSQDFNQEQVSAAIPESQFNWENLLLGIYTLISLLFLYRFVRNITILVNKIQRNVKINYRGQTLVLLKEDSLPFSFLKYIFVAKSDLEDGKFTDAVFAHECTHIQERHSWDNLFIEALLVPFWFHPGLHWAKLAIKLNHEFIADEVALRSTPLEKYKSQLLAMMLSEQKYGLVSSLNFSLTKKRFEMMKRKSMNSRSWIKILVLVPVLAVLVYFFSERVIAKAESNSTMSELYVNASKANLDEIDFDLTMELKSDGSIYFENKEYSQDQAKEFIKGRKSNAEDFKINLITSSTTKMGDLGDFQKILADLGIRRINYMYPNQNESDESRNKSDLTAHFSIRHQGQLSRNKVGPSDEKGEYYRNASIFVENAAGELVSKSYEQLNEEEKMLLHPPLKSPTTKQPSKEEFESWKNSKNFAIWINEKNVPNSQLNQMSHSEIVLFFDSFVHLNARSERFPQEHQVHLYTEKGFEETFGAESGFGEPLTEKDKRYLYPSARRVNHGKPWVRKVKEPVAAYQEKYAEYQISVNKQLVFRKKTVHEMAILFDMFTELNNSYVAMPLEDKMKVHRVNFPYVRIENEGNVIFKNFEDLTQEEISKLKC
jgi:beta-lactamase regulating signal transducer with metallopeptidase domain